jgi:UDP-N-acetylmuramoyl-tripeptide--D-alanyl-D-alanine ligase
MTYGERSQATAENAVECGVPYVRSFLDKDELADALYEILEEGDAVLFKASRGMALEDVINKLYEKLAK